MRALAAAAIERWVRPAIRSLAAYRVHDAGGYVKLDAMENPYTLPQALLDEWLEVLRGVQLNRYPDPEAASLKTRLRDWLEVPDGSELLLGNGSDELIQMVALALAGPGRTLLAPEPGFAMYPLIARVTGLEYRGVPLRADDFALDVEDMLAAIAECQPAVVFLACPNNPTGNLLDREAVLRILAAAPGLVVLDEAYHSFAGETFMGDLPDHPRLLVMRTLSKVGLAGLRIGVLAGAPQWLAELNKLRLPYNINVLSQASAGFILQHAGVLDEQAARIRGDREWLYRQLAAMPGVRVWPSRANFLLLRVSDAPAVDEALKARGILLRNLHGAHPLLANCLRVTVSTGEENRLFLEALRQALD